MMRCKLSKGMKRFTIILSVMLVGVLTACTVSYKFTGTSIDYTKIKSISLDKFPIRANYVWSPMESMFYNTISDIYAQKTNHLCGCADGADGWYIVPLAL